MPEQIPIAKKETEIMPEIKELERPARKIIEQILPGIEAGDYGIIIGDDASGRIPALILGNFIKKVCEEKSLEKPGIVFIPGKLEVEGREDELEEFLSQHGFNPSKKILIVTEAIESGASLSHLRAALDNLGYNYEIATVGLESPRRWSYFGLIRRLNLGSSKKIKSGGYYSVARGHTPSIYNKQQFSGVKKLRHRDTSLPLRSLGYYEDSKREEHETIMRKTREDSAEVISRLLDWYHSRKHE